jgi:hypothetical protein
MNSNQEAARLQEAGATNVPWRKWGPYLSERQWGTVREDYSQNGDAWDYLTHDQARSRAYHWGEDGLAGVSDDKQFLCFALALWNGKDPILKERLYGLTNTGGNHGEDVKEYYFYLDSTPTHSYMKYRGNEKFQTDPQWRDYIPFHEYFHGDNGAGIGASHQTGWTGVVASIIRLFGRVNAEQYLAAGHAGAFGKKTASGAASGD